MNKYTWCTKEEWLDDYFDLEEFESERGAFNTFEEARASALKNGAENPIVLEIS